MPKSQRGVERLPEAEPVIGLLMKGAVLPFWPNQRIPPRSDQNFAQPPTPFTEFRTWLALIPLREIFGENFLERRKSHRMQIIADRNEPSWGPLANDPQSAV